MAEATPVSPPQPEATRRTGGFRVPIWVAAVAAGFIVLAIGFAVGWGIGDHGGGRGDFGEHRDGGGGFGGHGGGRGIGIIVFLVLIALVITAVILVVRHFGSRPQTARSAENLLAERFARGEIDEAEYQRRRDALRG